VVALFPVYVLLSILVGGIAFILAMGVAALFNSRDLLPIAVFTIVFFSGLLILWLHYIVLNFKALISSVMVEGDTSTIARIAQALLTTIFGFGVIYYYLQLFGDNKSFAGMHPILITRSGSELLLVDRLAVIPPYESLVDCFYFSVTTISTLGFGDIYPQTPAAKIVTSCEVIIGFILIVVSLGSVIGGAKVRK